MSNLVGMLTTTTERDWTWLTFSLFSFAYATYNIRCIKFMFIREQTLTNNWMFYCVVWMHIIFHFLFIRGVYYCSLFYECRYLVPADLTVGQFVYVVRKRIKLSPEKAIFIFVKNILPPTGNALGFCMSGCVYMLVYVNSRETCCLS